MIRPLLCLLTLPLIVAGSLPFLFGSNTPVEQVEKPRILTDQELSRLAGGAAGPHNKCVVIEGCDTTFTCDPQLCVQNFLDEMDECGASLVGKYPEQCRIKPTAGTDECIPGDPIIQVAAICYTDDDCHCIRSGDDLICDPDAMPTLTIEMLTKDVKECDYEAAP